MANNKNLGNAKVAKNNEFYTQLVDIEAELCHYTHFFENKVVFCNCDDPYESNFFKYFALNFNHLGLKKLIATCYDSSPISYTQMNYFGDNKSYANINRHAYKIEINDIKDYNNDGATDLSDVDYLLQNKNNSMVLLKEDGDFRSKECIELLQLSDIVVTNPPFSLFREYVAQLFEYNKNFLIIANQNAITYKEIFPLIKDNNMWLGLTMNGSNRYFQVPDSYPLTEKSGKMENGKKYAFVKGVIWFTNLDVSKYREPITLYKKYTPEEYQTYENYNAININKVNDIPYDYDGYMGVPITFMHKYNPKQFEIIGLGISNSGLEFGVQPYKPEHKKYRKEIQHKGAVDGDLYMLDKDNHPEVPYARIIIKRRKTNGKNYLMKI